MYVTKAGIPRDDENKSNRPPMYEYKSAGNTDLKAPINGYWRRSDCRLELLFHHWSAGELISLVKSIVLYTDEINQKIALKLSKT